MIPTLTTFAALPSPPVTRDFDYMVSRIERWDRARRNALSHVDRDRIDAVYSAALGLIGLCHAFGLLADAREHDNPASSQPYMARGMVARVSLIVDALIIEANGALTKTYGFQFPPLPVRPGQITFTAKAA